MQYLDIFNLSVAVIFTLCYSYQIFYLVYSSIKKPKEYPEAEQNNRYAILISARNERTVIGYLLDSIKNQTYPAELIDCYVVADNCDDDTAEIAVAHGAKVYERFDKDNVGKGHALQFLLKNIKKELGFDYYNAYFVIDADNLLDHKYIAEMHKCFCAGNRIITSYRNSKNYGGNWISAGYSLWFMREARHLNNARNLLGTSCAVSGTGFMVHSDIIAKQNGWKHFLLTEDIEFTTDSVIHGEKIAYCHSAMLYDEQPVKFSQSYRQRLRWAKGFLQVMRHYSVKLLKEIVMRRNFSCFDMLMTVAPAFFLSLTNLFVNIIALIYSLAAANEYVIGIAYNISHTIGGVYGFLLVLGIVTGLFEWKNIHCPAYKKILYFFTFPIFMLTYIPISCVALFVQVKWKPIEHNIAIDTDDIEST